MLYGAWMPCNTKSAVKRFLRKRRTKSAEVRTSILWTEPTLNVKVLRESGCLAPMWAVWARLRCRKLPTAAWVSFHALEDEKGQCRRRCFMYFLFLQNTQIGLAVALLWPVYSSHLSKHTNKPAALPPNAQHTWLIFYFFFFLPQLDEEVMQGVKSAGLRRRFLWVCVSTLLRCRCRLMAKLGIAIIGRLIK